MAGIGQGDVRSVSLSGAEICHAIVKAMTGN